MAKKMNAAVVEKFGEPLHIREVPIPNPGPGQVLVQVVASGSATPTFMPPMAIGP